MIARLFSPCLFGHSSEWTMVRVNGQLHRACSRCQTPLGAILAHRGAAEDIKAASVPAITVRHAVTAKKVRTRKTKSRDKSPFRRVG